MWLVQLHKANDDAPIEDDVYITNSCEANYIVPNSYLTHILNLCDAWNYDTRSILILNKNSERTTISQLQNERFMVYYITLNYFNSSIYRYFISLEYLENEDFFIEFYVNTGLLIRFNIPDDILYDQNTELALLRHIKGKTLNINVLGSQTPKYSVEFDNHCKYYVLRNSVNIIILAIKNPFCVQFVLQRRVRYIQMIIWIKPGLIEDFNEYEQSTSGYDSNNDQPLRIDDIISRYFDSNAKTGVLHDGIHVDDNDENFRYSLIRALLEVFKNDITSYYFEFGGELGTVEQWPYDFQVSLEQTSLCIYFPLFRPQIDNNGVTRPKPQYDPNDTGSYVDSFRMTIFLNNDGTVNSSSIMMTYGNSLSNPITCPIWVSGYIPSWRFDSCDLTRPFRFAGVTDCDGIDEWGEHTRVYNSNYIFRIIKSSSSNFYSIKGIGCGELTENVYSFSNFSSFYVLDSDIQINTLEEIHRIAFFGKRLPH